MKTVGLSIGCTFSIMIFFVFSPGNSDQTQDDQQNYLLTRQNRLSRHLAGPWLWSHVTLNASGVGTITLPRPHELGSHLQVSGFSIQKEKGLSVMDKPVEVLYYLLNEFVLISNSKIQPNLIKFVLVRFTVD